VGELRTARNHWAHPDEDHPFDLDYAARVHLLVEEVLRAIDSPLAVRAAEASEDLRWAGVRDRARERGVSESEAVLQQLDDVQREYDELRGQLDDARAQAQSATGRSRAVARQLAELQSQYAAVAGLHDQYEELQRQLNEERRNREREFEDTSVVRDRLSAAEQALSGLRDEAGVLRDQLVTARAQAETFDPTATEAGRRWIWLVAGLIAMLAILLAATATLPMR
jgi:chromosome segregation ATPase